MLHLKAISFEFHSPDGYDVKFDLIFLILQLTK